jgi:hypothetical protein
MEDPNTTGAKVLRSLLVSPGTTYATTWYSIVGVATSKPAYPETLRVVKKNSPGDSCRNFTPCTSDASVTTGRTEECATRASNSQDHCCKCGVQYGMERTCDTTGASRNTTKSLLKQKHVRMAIAAARPPTSTRSLNSSRWSQIGIEKSSGSSSLLGLINFCIEDGSESVTLPGEAGPADCVSEVKAVVRTLQWALQMKQAATGA